jgi:hypothetical protein
MEKRSYIATSWSTTRLARQARSKYSRAMTPEEELIYLREENQANK